MPKEYNIEDASFEGVFCNSNNFGFRIEWEASLGFGQFDFYYEGDKLIISNELMSKDFIKAVMNKLIDKAILESD